VKGRKAYGRRLPNGRVELFSPRREIRRQLGWPSGRQWKHIYRQLRAEAKARGDAVTL
jgi:hypothetical protein